MELLSLRVDSDTQCVDVKRLAKQKNVDVMSGIKDLESIAGHPQALIAECDNGERSLNYCPVVRVLDPRR